MEKTKTDYTRDCQVVIATDEEPSRRDWDFPLTEHWLCRAHRGAYFVFVIPESDNGFYHGAGLPLGVEPLVTLDKLTAVYFLQQWVREGFAFVSRGGPELPGIGYLIRPGHLTYPREPSIFYEPVHAVRIQVDENHIPVFEGGFLDLNCILDYKRKLVRSASWVRNIWQAHVLPLSQYEDQYTRQLGRWSIRSKPFEGHTNLDIACEDTAKKYLLIGHLFAYWQETDTKLEERARQMKRLGMEVSEAAGTIANLQVAAGLAQPNRKRLAKLFAEIAEEAATFGASDSQRLEEMKSTDFSLLEHKAQEFLLPVYPDLFDTA